MNNKIKGFTLIELLIVIAITGVLATVVVIIINPSEIMKETRDFKRFEELNHINIAVSEAVSLSPNINLGIASSVYVSIPDSSATCANLGLSTSSLPSGWSYRCSTSANFRKVDGTGWIPVNFSSVEGGSVFAVLPVDPINATSSGLYYTYTSGGSFQFSALFESFKYADKAAKDGGIDSAQYEVGDNLALAPFTHGLVGYWKFDEGSGSSVADLSNSGHTGDIGSNTWQVNGCVDDSCLHFPGINNFTIIAGVNKNVANISITYWIKPTTSGLSYFHWNNHGLDTDVGTWMYPDNSVSFYIEASGIAYRLQGLTGLSINSWNFIAVVYDGVNMKIYLNGNLDVTQNHSTGGNISWSGNPTPSWSFGSGGGADPFVGLLDEARIYNRALSASEIKAMYNATK